MQNIKTLVVTYYWCPYNNPGTFRWANFNKFIDFDVLTCRRPLRSFLDRTIRTPNYDTRVYKFGWRLPAVIWGFFAPFIALFKKYDQYIFTSPPESMLIGAYVLQLFGKNVFIDMRDSIDREKQTLKLFVPVYTFFYRRMHNVIVAYKFLDETKPVIYHGYEELTTIGFHGYYNERLNNDDYKSMLAQGYIPDQSKKPKGYASGSGQTLRYLGLPINNTFHEEFYSHKLIPVEDSAYKLQKLLKEF